jgi:phosphonate transport system permease protein
MVGAGGVGVVLWEVIRAFRFPETCAVILRIIATVTIVDLASARLRRMFV